MGRIHVLDKHVAELIAAGEVVDRPSSVVKELLENAVDAGATTVTVEIKHGGVTYLRITDNGCGIAREDVPTAFLRHATSKVNNQSDLEEIGTLGFRGEALASIAAVARVELLTRVGDALEGTRYVIAGGEEEACEDAGCPAGTTIVVRDLFYNTPARMKFLKKDVVEGNSVASVMDKIALSHPEISFRFLRDGKETLHTPGDGQLKSAIYAVYGREFTQGLIPVSYEYGGVSVNGYVSKPAAARPNRSMQNFFLNGRYVKSRTAMVALEEAFKGSLMVGKLPACVLHLSVSCRSVDVNVHPAKIEVRFVNEKPLFDCVYHGVKTALNEGDTPKVAQVPAYVPPPVFAGVQPQAKQLSFTPQPAASASEEPEISVPRLGRSASSAGRGVVRERSAFPALSREEPKKPEGIPLWSARPVSVPQQADPAIGKETQNVEVSRTSLQEKMSGSPADGGSLGAPDSARENVPAPAEQSAGGISAVSFPKAEPQTTAAPVLDTQSLESRPPVLPEPVQENPDAEIQEEERPFRLVGEAFGTYVILERGDELVWIDKHAAHERMLYEKLKAERSDADCQLLLEPVAVTLEKNEYAAVLEARELFGKAGFEIDDFGGGTVLVRTAPLILEGEGIADAVMEMAGYLVRSKTDLTTEKLDWLYHNVACRAAIKAGDETPPEELEVLARRLAAHPEIRYCPHGRPVSIVMRRRDLEKQFGRLQ